MFDIIPRINIALTIIYFIPRINTINSININIEFDWKTNGQVKHICLTLQEVLFKSLINRICLLSTTIILYSVLYDNIKFIYI